MQVVKDAPESGTTPVPYRYDIVWQIDDKAAASNDRVVGLPQVSWKVRGW